MMASGRQTVADDPELLAMMMADARAAPGAWRAKARWHGYAERIGSEIARVGLAGFRTNPRILKGYATGGVPEVAQPRAAWKRALWRLVAAAPLTRRIITEERLLKAGEHTMWVATARAHARLVLEALARDGLDIAPPAGLDHGGAEDSISWGDHTVTAIWVEHVARAVELYREIPDDSVTSLMEIGSGLGSTTLAHRALNPGLRIVVNVDIPPVLYVATQFLRSIPNLDVVDYRATRDSERIAPEPAKDGRLRVYMLAPWQTPRLAAGIDLFLNAASFQEMDRETCEAYAEQVGRIVAGHAVLIAGAEGRDWHNAVDVEFLLERFGVSFPHRRMISGVWQDHYEPGYVTYLLAREEGR